MPNSITFHFHQKHFKETGLPFSEYVLLLLYELREDWELDELKDVFHLSYRTIARMRTTVESLGFLKKIEKTNGKYKLTDKMYTNGKAGQN